MYIGNYLDNIINMLVTIEVWYFVWNNNNNRIIMKNKIILSISFNRIKALNWNQWLARVSVCICEIVGKS
jgi:hypothetical protein